MEIFGVIKPATTGQMINIAFIWILISIAFVSENPCEKCDINKVKVVQANLDRLTFNIICDFLCTFDSSCNSNIEYSEFSNEILFKALEYAPTVFFEVISKGQVDNNLLLKEIKNPNSDLINLQIVYDKIKTCSAPKPT